MSHTHWLHTPLIGRARKKQSVACVLSGGGSRASFQLGALNYLYRHDPGFTPSIFVGASAGSILAAGLAQYSDRDDQKGFTQQLTEIWRGLSDTAQMFTPRPWLVRAQAEAPGWLHLMNPAPPAHDAPSRSFPKLPFMRSDSPASPTSAPDKVLGPLEMALTPDVEITPEWSLGTLTQLFSNIGKLPRIGSDLLSIQRGMENTKSLYRPGTVLLKLLDPDVFDPARVRSAGTTLRIAMVALESGELRFMREDGALVDRDDRLFDAGPHPLATGILASSSIPAVFRPVPLGAETYVDGGVRDNLPAQLAMEHLGADRTYLISSKGVGVPTRQSMRDADLFAIVMRATEILIDEAGRDELEYAATTDALTIAPELDVHDAMSVDPGLIAINIDYGWLRAAELVLDLGAQDIERHRRLVALRVRCVRLEQQLLAQPPPAKNVRDAVVDTLVQAKTEMRDLVDACEPAALPEGADQWWCSFEPHQSEPGMKPPWLPVADTSP